MSRFGIDGGRVSEGCSPEEGNGVISIVASSTVRLAFAAARKLTKPGTAVEAGNGMIFCGTICHWNELLAGALGIQVGIFFSRCAVDCAEFRARNCLRRIERVIDGWWMVRIFSTNMTW